ncbi:MAG: hypothetical protein R3C20_24600, partial [Planctomycetaceae bacterium]
SGTWVLNGDTGSGPGARQFELVVGEAGAGFTSFIGPPEDGKGRSWYQASANIVASDEPPDQYGLLTGALQLRHLLNKLDGNFDDAQAGGRTVHQPSGAVVDVLITRSGAMLSRWYFDQKQSFPFGVDITIGEGLDEARLLFADWEESSPTSNEKSPILPGRIGVIDSDTEAVRWLNITEASFRTSGETR